MAIVFIKKLIMFACFKDTFSISNNILFIVFSLNKCKVPVQKTPSNVLFSNGNFLVISTQLVSNLSFKFWGAIIF